MTIRSLYCDDNKNDYIDDIYKNNNNDNNKNKIDIKSVQWKITEKNKIGNKK